MSTEVDTRITLEAGDSLEAELQRLKSMVEGSRVPEARAFVQVLEERWPQSPVVQYWARVLAPPRVLPSPQIKGRPMRREYAWLKEHANEYPGQWLSVYGDRLIAASHDLREVVGKTREAIGDERALLTLAPETSD